MKILNQSRALLFFLLAIPHLNSLGDSLSLKIHNKTDGQIKVHLWKFLNKFSAELYPIEFTMERQTCNIPFIEFNGPVKVTATSGSALGNQLIIKPTNYLKPYDYMIILEIRNNKTDPKKLEFTTTEVF